MQTTAWRRHEVQEGHCVRCGAFVPEAAITVEPLTLYATAYSNGAIWSPKPQGNDLPCRLGR